MWLYSGRFEKGIFDKTEMESLIFALTIPRMYNKESHDMVLDMWMEEEAETFSNIIRDFLKSTSILNL